MTLESLYLAIAIVMLTGLALAANLKAGSTSLKAFTLALFLVGMAGLCALIVAAAFGWDVLGGAR